MSLFEIKPGTPSVEEFLDLRGSVEMGTRSLEGVKRGLGNELFGALLYLKDGGELVGMGRVVGDGGTVFHICDMVVKPEWQKKGGVDGFYEKWGFKPTDPRSKGMYLKS